MESCQGASRIVGKTYDWKDRIGTVFKEIEGTPLIKAKVT